MGERKSLWWRARHGTVAVAAVASFLGAMAGAAPVASGGTVPGIDGAGVTWLCRPGLPSDPVPVLLRERVVGPGIGFRDGRDGPAGRPPRLRLLLRVPDGHRFGGHRQHRHRRHRRRGGRSGRPGVAVLPGVQRLGPHLPAADVGVAGQGARERPAGRPRVLRQPVGRVEGLPGPRQPRAARSSSSATPRARPI